jgi:hypothetical protein
VAEIPPDVLVIGPIAARVDEIAERVRENLHADPLDAWVETAVDAALVYVIDQTNRADVGLPDDELTVHGLVGFASRIYLDAFSPGGAQVAVGDTSFAPIFNPEHLFKHWRHYFLRLYPSWGIG